LIQLGHPLQPEMSLLLSAAIWTHP
jgi:hypothetical protein